MRHRSSAAAWMLALATVTAGAQTAADRALDLFNRATREPDPKRKVELFRQSVEAYETPEGTISLGNAIVQSGGDLLEARRLCNHAFANLVNPEAPNSRRIQAAALVCMARSHRAANERGSAVVLLKRSIAIERTEVAERELRELIDTGVKSAPEIVAALKESKTTAGVTRGAVVTEAVDLYVNFDYDKATLRPDGVRQVEQLAQALEIAARGLARARYRVIGHTDTRGSDPYNDDLSQRRAMAVRDLLVSKYGMRPAELIVEGRGKREPLLSGNTEEDHARNRRVEIQRLPE